MTQSPTDKTVEAVALKPCPFCGGPSTLIRPMGEWMANPDATGGSYGPDRYRVVCSGLYETPIRDCPGRGAYDTELEAIAAWNTRAPIPASPPSPAGDVERVAWTHVKNPPAVGGHYAVGGYVTTSLGRGFERAYATCIKTLDGPEWSHCDPQKAHIPIEYWYDLPSHPELAALQPSPSPAGDVERARVIDSLHQILNLDVAEIAKSPSFVRELVREAIAALQLSPSPASNGAMPAAGMGEVDKPTVERCIHILRGSLLAGYGPDALAQRDSDIAVLEREILASTTSGERS